MPNDTPCFTVLVVEDDEEIRKTVVELIHLEFPTCTTREAVDGQAALDALAALDRPPCLVLLDLMMPGVSGWDVLAVMRHDDALSSIPVVVMTASRLDAKGARDYLRKPFSLEALREVVRHFCGAG